jgi:hypothetical protein
MQNEALKKYTKELLKNYDYKKEVKNFSLLFYILNYCYANLLLYLNHRNSAITLGATKDGHLLENA